jgi:acetylornithine deacetylase/succinyl-diaminopimelate desuccinylase-like protein
MRPVLLATLLIAVSTPAIGTRAQPARPAGPALAKAVGAYVEANQRQIMSELVELVSIPNVASDTENIRENARLLHRMLAGRGFSAEILETDGNPLVYGEMKAAGASRTLLVYCHYDGQPVDPRGWKQPSPFTPILRDGRLEDGGREIPGGARHARAFEPGWRLYARSASDDKSPIVGLLAALDALKHAGVAPTSNLRVLFDGEEESGSPSLVAAISKYRDRFDADLMIILDGPVHPSERPTVVFGARGVLGMELTVYGPKFPLHSGHYGNWAPNPAMRLAALLASMKDDDGKVLVKGFYDGLVPLTPEEQAMLDAVPDDPARLMRLFGFAAPERRDLSLQAALQLPSLNVRGLSSAFVGGEARTIVPDRAIAALDVRLVKETPAASMAEKIRAHIRAQGYHVVESEPDDETRARHERIVKIVSRGGTDAYRTSPLLDESRRVAGALADVFGEPPVLLRTSGGTVPIAPFIAAMAFPALGVPTVNFDNNQHGENENLRLGHFFLGIVTIAAVLTM